MVWFKTHAEKPADALHVMVDTELAETFYPVKSDHFALFVDQSLNRFFAISLIHA